MKYSIIIPTYNHLSDCLEPCLISIIKSTKDYLDNEIAEIVVVCNGCTDDSELFVETLSKSQKGIVLISTPNAAGYTRATNMGIAAARGEYFVLFNNDCEILEWGKNGSWLDMLHEPFKEDETVAVSGPKKIPAKDTGYPDKSFIVFFCAMISRKAIEILGILDDSFSPGGGEDIDFCFKAQAAGMKTVTVPEDIVNPAYGGTSFPIWHRGEQTVHDENSIKRTEWESGFWDRMHKIGNRIKSGYYNKWEPKSMPIGRLNVLVDVCTRGRYRDTLPLCLQSIVSQTVSPREIRVYCDDDPGFNIGEDSLYKPIIIAANTKGIIINFVKGEGIGQVRGHELARLAAIESGFDFVWRIDDDNIAEPTVLGLLGDEMKDNVGAVAGSVPDPNALSAGENASTLFKDIFSGKNLQWTIGQGVVDAEHLYSTFLYRVSTGISYRNDLSKVGHREETFFSHDIWQDGWDLKIVRHAITWHYRAPKGGIRSETDIKLWQSDEAKFQSYFTTSTYSERIQRIVYTEVVAEPTDVIEYFTTSTDSERIQRIVYTEAVAEPVNVIEYNQSEHIFPELLAGKKMVYFNMNFGMGDHVMAFRVLDKIAHRLKNKKCVFYVCYHNVFDDYWKSIAEKHGITDWTIKSVGEGQAELGQKRFDELSVYWWMIYWNWSKHAMEAMEACYNEQLDKIENN